MAGLRRIAKLCGGMVIQGVEWSWDYAADDLVLTSEMSLGSARWKASERAKWAHLIPAESSAQGSERSDEGNRESAVAESADARR